MNEGIEVIIERYKSLLKNELFGGKDVHLDQYQNQEGFTITYKGFVLLKLKVESDKVTVFYLKFAKESYNL